MQGGLIQRRLAKAWTASLGAVGGSVIVSVDYSKSIMEEGLMMDQRVGR